MTIPPSQYIAAYLILVNFRVVVECWGRQGYASPEKAERSAKHILKDNLDGMILRPVTCRHCGKWHLRKA